MARLSCADPRVLECGNPFHDDYATLAKHHANRMFCLAKYLHWDNDRQPVW